MELIVDGVVYATERDELLAAMEKKTSEIDMYAWGEALYRNASGDFYLYCHGTPYSRYGSSRTSRNCFAQGEQIKPLSLDEAHEWAQRYMDEPELAGLFSDQISL